jgi:signal peptidase I
MPKVLWSPPELRRILPIEASSKPRGNFMSIAVQPGFLRRNRGIIVFLLLMIVFRSSFADWNTVPSGSMQPTIVEGDRILIDKLAFDLNVPLVHKSLVHLGDPVRGDVVVFESEAARTRLVKRVMGVPGDVVEMVDNRLVINGVPAQYTDAKETPLGLVETESVAGVTHRVLLNPRRPSPLANFGPVTVPEGHYLMLGDARDNSSDSRVYGFVPRGEITGRTRSVVLSFNYDNYYLPRSDRFFHKL